MSNSPSLIIKTLTIIGISKNYIIPFKPGVNIIWGDLDCGKSSILSIISYCLGASTLDTYNELEEKARTARLVVELNKEVYIFERELFNENQYIKCYKNEIDQEVAPIILSPNLDGDAPDGYISFFIMDLLGLPVTKVKVSPSRTDSTMNRVGFKDILKFLYLKQKDIASDSLLNMNEGFRYVKHKEIIKFLFNIHNQTISELESALAEQQGKLNKKIREKNEITNFLQRVNFDFNFDYNSETKKNNEVIELINCNVVDLKNDYSKAAGISSTIESRLLELSKTIERTKYNINKYEKELSDYIKLRASYINEKRSISTSLKVESTFNDIHKTKIKCPLCQKEQCRSTGHGRISLEVLESEKKSIQRKILNLNSLIDDVRNGIELDLIEEQSARNTIAEIQYTFDSTYAKEVSELIESISLLEKQKVDLLSNKKIMDRDRSIINRLDIINSEEINIERVMNRLGGDLIKAKENSEDSDDVIERLSNEFNSYMINSLLNNVESSMVDDKLDYIVRDKPFTKLTSGGVRTITSLGIFLSKFIYALKYNSNIPTFIMIDTPGNNIGRYRQQDVNSEDISSDQKVYEQVYQQFLSIAEYASDNDKDFQIIVVDNDLAVSASDHKDVFNIAKRFSKHDPNFDYGLINDYLV
jgi:hypothetical protein